MYKVASAILVGFVSLSNAVTRDELRDVLSNIITDKDDLLRLEDYLDFADNFGKLDGIDISNVDELKTRFSNWKDTDDHIRDKGSKSNRAWTMGHTRFSDWSLNEKSKILLEEKYLHSKEVVDTHSSSCLRVSLTDSSITSNEYYNIDNRDYDIAGIQDQGNCASCWDFSDIATIELNRNLDYGYQVDKDEDSFVKLSEQMVLDCTSDNIGTCEGGYPLLTMEWVTENGGISESKNYHKYKEEEGSCDTDAETSDASLYTELYCLVDETVEQVAYAASRFSVQFAFAVYKDFYNYDNGVYSCDTDDDFIGWHAVTIVGITEEYFIVKNSWSTKWGEKGYVKISRESFDDCSMSRFSFVSFNDIESSLTNDDTSSSSSPTMDVAQVTQLRTEVQTEMKSNKKNKNKKNNNNNNNKNKINENNIEKEENIPGVDKIKVNGTANYTILFILAAVAGVSLLLCFGGLTYKACRNCKNEKRIKSVVNAHEESALLDGYVAL